LFLLEEMPSVEEIARGVVKYIIRLGGDEL
jgi:hypothetical protein